MVYGHSDEQRTLLSTSPIAAVAMINLFSPLSHYLCFGRGNDEYRCRESSVSLGRLYLTYKGVFTALTNSNFSTVTNNCIDIVYWCFNLPLFNKTVF